MRELKFRVYIPDHEKFCYFTLGNFDYSDRYLHQHSYPVQQYTGLKDKNGKEIYEGDIVKFQYGATTRPSGVFAWCENRAGWVIKPFSTLSIEVMYNVEVVGNIFEIPELLK